LVVLAVLVGACAQPAQVPSVQVEDTSPAVEDISSIVEEPTAVVEEPTPVVEEPTPVVEEPASAAEDSAESPDPLVTGLEGASGSAVGPDGALYVTEGQAGRVSRVDPQSGETTTLIEGLPPAVLPIGGAVDVAFVDGTAYVLVTMVGADLPVEVETPGVVGIYRVDGPDSFTVVADIGAWSIANPSESEVAIPSGVHYALDPHQGGFLVSDGHHNRVLFVTLDGQVSEMMAFGNIVPTGLAVAGETVYMAEAGPNPHLPEDGKIVQIGPEASMATEVASGAPLLVDVEIGSDGVLYALAQGNFPEGADDGAPATPNTASLVAVNEDGAFSVVADGLNQPTSLEFIGNTAYVVTLSGEVRTLAGVLGSP
jgi:sugar lactone lactonase YvrE